MTDIQFLANMNTLVYKGYWLSKSCSTYHSCTVCDLKLVKSLNDLRHTSQQLRCVLLSLDIESVKTLVHAFVTPHIDYCNYCLKNN